MLGKHSVASSLAAVTDSVRVRIGGLQDGYIYTLLKVINATANGETRVIQNIRTECEPLQFGSSRERIGGLQASGRPTAGWPYLYAIEGYKRNGK